MADFLLGVGVTLLAALVLGEAAERLGQPGLLGEIGAGVLLGPHLLDVLDLDGSFGLFATVGALLLFFDVGYEGIDVERLLHAGPPATLIGLVGMAVPGVAGVALGRGFGYDLAASLFLGLVLAVTSIAVSVRTLVHLDRLDTPYGLRIVGAAVVDDVVGLLCLSLLLAILRGQSAAVLVETLVGVVAFFAAVGAFAWAIRRVSRALERSVQSGATFLAIMGSVFVFGFLADVVGLTASIGAFAVGLVVGTDRHLASMSLREGVVGAAYGLFIPLFFASIGAQLNLRLLSAADAFVVAVVLVGVLAKVAGGYLGGRLTRIGHRESLSVGVGLVPKSEVGLAIVSIGLSGGFIDDRIFSAFLVLTLVSVLVTPPLLQLVVPDSSSSDPGAS